MGKIGRYQLKAEIGRGGMGTVYRALDPNTNREVAIKVLPREMIHNPSFLARFRKELAVISSLEHSAIVPVYDGGEQDGQPYFVMRYMPGGSLKEWLKSGPLSLQDTARIVERLSLGLAYAHRRGIVHRDIKPDNVLFDANNEPYLSDFGVAKLADSVTISSTGSGIIGTPGYLSPEQARGENNRVDHRADIYGLGVLTYQMLTGEQPYQADTPMGVLVKHIHEPVPNILEHNPDLPPAVDTILKTALAKEREDRYPSVLEFARALSVAAFGEERTMPAELMLERRQAGRSSRKRNRWVIAGFFSLAALLVLYLSLQGSPFFAEPFSIPVPAETTKTAVLPSMVPTSTNSPLPATATSTSLPTATQEITLAAPTPPGGAERIALLSRNTILSMDIDGNRPESLDTQNFTKASLQWLADGRLFYISPTRNCAYLAVPSRTKIICFIEKEKLTGFRVSPDGSQVAISVDNTLYIVPYQEPFRETSWKGETITKDLLGKKPGACRVSGSIKDVRWSRDGSQVAALVVDPAYYNSEQIHLFSVNPANCQKDPVPVDKFPANIPDFDPEQHYKIQSYDWDGDHRFLLNDALGDSDSVFGYLYLYDSKTHEGKRIGPVGLCCYADARWSPDGNYILFLYKDSFQQDNEAQLYYIPASNLDELVLLPPVTVPPDTLTGLNHIYPAVKPAE